MDLEPIKARLAAATPGPWRQRKGASRTIISDGHCPGLAGTVAILISAERDGALIANAPTDLAALVAEVERLRLDVADHEYTVKVTSDVFDKMRARAEAAEARANNLASLVTMSAEQWQQRCVAAEAEVAKLREWQRAVEAAGVFIGKAEAQP